MLAPKPVYQKPRFWRWAITLVLALVTLYAFRGEITTLWQWFTGAQILNLEDPSHLRTIFVVLANAGGFFLLLLGFLLFISQFVLPVQFLQERRKVFSRLWLYLLGMHGPAIKVKEGEKVARLEELQSSRPGVAFVDLASAIVLEKQWFSGGSRTAFTAGARGLNLQRLTSMARSVRPVRRQRREPVNARAAGPGLVFTEFGERVRGAVSLRRQFRGKMVKGSLRDGFEASAFVFVIFTLGDDPEVLRLGHTGEEADSLRVIQVDEKKKTIRALSDDLDADDRLEVHRFARSGLETVPPLPQGAPPEPEQAWKQPFSFDERRVFNAVYGDARLPKEDKVEDWTELPLKVAVETFHDLIAYENYDQLYSPEDPSKFPYRDEFKPRFARRVRNQGVLSFQYIRRKDGKPFAVDQPWDESELDIYPVQPLRTSRVLRDRGVRVVFAGCGDLTPKEEVLHQRFLNWQAKWQSRYDQTLALYDYKAMQIRAHARAQAQRDMVFALSELMQKSIPREVLAIRLLQSLESFASAPETQKLLPRETLGELTNIQRLLMPGKPTPPAAPSSGVPPL